MRELFNVKGTFSNDWLTVNWLRFTSPKKPRCLAATSCLNPFSTATANSIAASPMAIAPTATRTMSFEKVRPPDIVMRFAKKYGKFKPFDIICNFANLPKLRWIYKHRVQDKNPTCGWCCPQPLAEKYVSHQSIVLKGKILNR